MDLERHDPGQQPSIRTSDAERDRVVALLRRHYVDGRLDFDEFNERMDAAHSARTRGELVVTLQDLPVLTAPSPAPAAPRPVQPRPFIPAVVPLLAIALFVGSLLVVSRGVVLFPLLFLWFIGMSRHRWHRHHGHRPDWHHHDRHTIRHL